MKVSLLLAILCGLIFSLAGISLIRESVHGIQNERIMSNGRRSSTLIDQDKSPGFFWVTVGWNCALALGLFTASFCMVRAAARPTKKN